MQVVSFNKRSRELLKGTPTVTKNGREIVGNRLNFNSLSYQVEINFTVPKSWIQISPISFLNSSALSF